MTMKPNRIYCVTRHKQTEAARVSRQTPASVLTGNPRPPRREVLSPQHTPTKHPVCSATPFHPQRTNQSADQVTVMSPNRSEASPYLDESF